MVPVRRLNHAVLYVSDLDRSVAFYERLFGFDVMAREELRKAGAITGESDHGATTSRLQWDKELK